MRLTVLIKIHVETLIIYLQAATGLVRMAFSMALDVLEIVSVSDYSTAKVYSYAHCVADYVNNNPSAFSNAYWQFNSVRVYE